MWTNPDVSTCQKAPSTNPGSQVPPRSHSSWVIRRS